MKNKIFIFILIIQIILLFLVGCIEEDKDIIYDKTLTEISIDFMIEIKLENLEKAYTYFNDLMKSQFTLSQFRDTWNTIISTYGNFLLITNTSESVQQGYDVVFVNCTFSNDHYIIFKIVFDDEKQISGFWTEKIESINSYSPPNYVEISYFSEFDVTIGSDPWILPGTVSVPIGEGPFPCVVLIHGSGPADRDETIGPNKPFKDIAWGLSSNDIIVLRFDKRTNVYSEKIAPLKNFTLEDEIIDDVYAAIDFLMSYDKVNQKQIFILGHSLGAMTAPKIATENDNISGMIMFAASVRGLEDLIYNQTVYLANLDGVIDQNELENIELVNKSREKIKELNITYYEQVLGAYRPYWEYLSKYDPVETTKGLSIPIMIIQGKRDYQVTFEEDYYVWNSTFSNSDNVILKSYEGLNHLFIEGSGIPTNIEYLNEGHVAIEVIEDITEFIFGEI